MKMTIVLDTDDPQGLIDAYKIASFILDKHTHNHMSPKVRLGRIHLIKFLRQFAKECEDRKRDPDPDERVEDPSSLRVCKEFVDRKWESLIGVTYDS
jgi:hypothetical protein